MFYVDPWSFIARTSTQKKKSFSESQMSKYGLQPNHNNSCINMIYPCWKDIFHLSLEISFTAPRIKNFNLYFHKPAGYFLTDHLGSSRPAHENVWRFVLESSTSFSRCALVLQNAHLNEEAKRLGGAELFTVRRGESCCKLVLLPLTAQAGGEQGI